MVYGTHTEASTQRSEDNLQESVLSFYREDSREETQDVSLDGKHLHTLNNPSSPAWSIPMLIFTHVTILMFGLCQT